jgi:hypothetical protein
MAFARKCLRLPPIYYFRRVLRILQQPYPLYESRRSRWRMSLLFGVFVFLFLWLFEPIGFNEIPKNKMWHALGYGLVCTCTMLLINVVAVPLFPRFFREQSWTTGRQIAMTMLNIGLIGLANVLYTMFAFNQPFRWSSLLYFEAITLGIGLLPVAVSYVLNQLLLERRYQQGSGNLNAQIEQQKLLPPQTKQATESTLLLLEGDNQNEQLRVLASELRYLQAADNYVEIYWMAADGLQKALLRGSMRAFAEQLAAQPSFFRCHKSFLVNRQHIQHISGNAQGYKLKLDGVEALIPVSRSLNADLKQLFG